MTLAGLAVAGALGAVLRYLLAGFVQESIDSTLPWATFSINASGSFLLGVITGAALYHAFPATPRVVLGTGFCGAYTTFSTWSLEVVDLAESGSPGAAIGYAVLSIVAGTSAAALGLILAAL